jgi:hypothetical protein
MDADCYVIEQMIRDRLADARTSARWAVVLRQSKERSRRSNRNGSLLIDVGRSLINGAREGLRHLTAATQSDADHEAFVITQPGKREEGRRTS